MTSSVCRLKNRCSLLFETIPSAAAGYTMCPFPVYRKLFRQSNDRYPCTHCSSISQSGASLRTLFLSKSLGFMTLIVPSHGFTAMNSSPPPWAKSSAISSPPASPFAASCSSVRVKSCPSSFSMSLCMSSSADATSSSSCSSYSHRH